LPFGPQKVENTVEDMYPRHFGLIFPTKEELERIYKRAKEQGAAIYQEIFERHMGKPGAHISFFLTDPSNNLVEFKYYFEQDSVLLG
jgi:extradiol dioxygenase family protein